PGPRATGTREPANTSCAAAGHHQPDLFNGRAARFSFSPDLSVIDQEKTVCQSCHFLQFRRYEQDRAAGIAKANQFPMYELDRADIDTPRRLRNEREFGGKPNLR